MPTKFVSPLPPEMMSLSSLRFPSISTFMSFETK